MAKLLALETSAEACSVALSTQAGCIERHERLPKSHTEHLLPMVDALLAQAGVALSELDAIAFGRGPGSFTGLRVCAAVVQGLAFARDIPVAPVSSLRALALTAARAYAEEPGRVIHCCIDARMDEVYWAAYRLDDDGLPEEIQAEQLSAPEQVHWLDRTGALAVGSGWCYRERMDYAGTVTDNELLPRASAVAELALPMVSAGELVAPEQAVPHYLRDSVAWQKK